MLVPQYRTHTVRLLFLTLYVTLCLTLLFSFSHPLSHSVSHTPILCPTLTSVHGRALIESSTAAKCPSVTYHLPLTLTPHISCTSSSLFCSHFQTQGRALIESSTAAKCPSVTYHLSPTLFHTLCLTLLLSVSHSVSHTFVLCLTLSNTGACTD